MKAGIDFFPLDCHMERKFEFIEAEFGLKGFAIIVKLWQSIYGRNGYYCEWNSEVALLFSKEIGESGGVVSEVVQAALKREVFNQSIFEKFGVLTSHGIQVRFLEAAKRRKFVKMEKDYLLLSADEISKNVYIYQNNVRIFPENVDNFEQSKVEESKGKERKGNDRKAEEAFSASQTAAETITREFLVDEYGENIVSAYEKKFDEWKSEKGIVKANRYKTMLKMMDEDMKECIENGDLESWYSTYNY